MIYTALKRYEQALYCLEVVITTPAYAVSHVMLEAYKKYILVSLILYGKVSMTSYYVLVTIIVPRTKYNFNSLLPPLNEGGVQSLRMWIKMYHVVLIKQIHMIIIGTM